MKKINFFLAVCCFAAATSLNFKKTDFVLSADQVEAYSKSFAPTKKIGLTFFCCPIWPYPSGPGIDTAGHYCTTGTSTCVDKPCKSGAPCDASIKSGPSKSTTEL